MSNDKLISDEVVQNESNFEESSVIRKQQTIEFHPILYYFRTSPTPSRAKKYALPLPFSLLFDNLITVLWAVYGKTPNIICGVNQVQWAIEFLKTMKDDYNFPENIRKIVKDFEKYLIGVYAKVGEIMQLMKTKQELEEEKERENSSKEIKDDIPVSCTSYNEQEIVEKLKNVHVPMDIVTGEAKALRELNSLAYVIGALQKLLTIPSHETKSKVEELIKGLKV